MAKTTYRSLLFLIFLMLYIHPSTQVVGACLSWGRGWCLSPAATHRATQSEASSQAHLKAGLQGNILKWSHDFQTFKAIAQEDKKLWSSFCPIMCVVWPHDTAPKQILLTDHQKPHEIMRKFGVKKMVARDFVSIRL